jgi:hypothetical protein
MALVVGLYCGWAFRRTRATLGKILWLNVGVLVVACGAIEVGSWLSAPVAEGFDPAFGPGPMFVRHDDYGYGPATPSRTRVREVRGERVIYDVVYTIDDHGLRVAPPELDSARRRGCVVFFGCSNTYGDGVADDETLPWQVGVKSGGRFATRNFGFSGWGPHQMLATVQSGRVERTAGCAVTHVVYLALYSHATRAAGRAFWDRDGPRYVLDAEARAVRAGNFSDVKSDGVLRPILKRLRASQLFRHYMAAGFDPHEQPVMPAELDLLTAIVAATRDEAAVRFPGAPFAVLFWDIGLEPVAVTDLTTRLAGRGLRVHALSRAIPDHGGDADLRYRLSEGDGHPTAAAYARIAEYVLREILHDAE